MEADERTMDWAARQTAKERGEAEEATKALQKNEHDARLKDQGGIELFKRLHAWMDVQAKSYSGQIPTQAFEVGKIERFGGPDSHDFFNVSHTNRERRKMTISYRDRPHEITVECGVVPSPRYFLSVEDNGDLFFETSKGKSKTIAEIGSESLDSWKRAAM